MSVQEVPASHVTASANRGGDISSSRLFFIVGRSRSGTTLLQTMLDANPSLAVAPECQMIMNMYSKYHAARWSRTRILQFYRDLWLEGRLTTWELDKEKLRADLLSLEDHASFANLCKMTFMNYAQQHGKSAVRIYGDLNHHYSLFVDTLARVFPDSRFIHMVRDYRDNVLSHTKVTFDTNNISALAYRWKRYHRQILESGAALGDRMAVVRYEDLVTDPAAELTRLCRFLGVDFHPGMLQHHRHKRSTFGDPWQPNLRNPVNARRVEAWRKEMRPRDVAKCDLICAQVARRFGYDVSQDSKDAFTPWLRMSTLPGILAGWIRTVMERFVFFLPLRIRSALIAVSRTLNKSGPQS